MPSNVNLTVETNLTRELVGIIDEKLEYFSKKANETDIADLLGYFDSIEHLTGLGFVASQTYITAVYGISSIPKSKALNAGPMHPCGKPIVTIVNAAANYWKHNNEWRLEKSSKRRQIIEETFDEIGLPVDGEYPLSGVLAELSVPASASFVAIFRKLELWKDELLNKSDA